MNTQPFARRSARPLAQVAPVIGYTSAGAATAGGTAYVPGAYNFSVVATTRGVTPVWKSDAASVIADRLRTVGPVTPGTVYPGVIQSAPNGEYFVRVSGTFNATSTVQADPNSASGVFRALARGIFDSLNFTSGTAPRDGGGLLNRMLQNDYRAPGGSNGDPVFVAAVTTITRTLAPTATTQPVVPVTPMTPVTPTTQTTQQPVTAATPCIAPAPELFYLRSTPSFAVSGPRIGAGTQIEFLHNTGLVQGANRLWHVRVISSGATGYAVFTNAHTPACGASVPSQSTAIVQSQPAPTPAVTPTPVRPAPTVTRPLTTTQGGVGGGTSTGVKALLMVVGGAAVGGTFYYWNDIVAAVGGKKHAKDAAKAHGAGTRKTNHVGARSSR